MLVGLHEAGRAPGGTELALLGPAAVAWLAPADGTLASRFSRLSARPRYGAAITTRNLRTTIKVRDAAALLQAGAGPPVVPQALSALPTRPC